MYLLQVLGYHITVFFMVKCLEHSSLFSKTSIIINTCTRDFLLQDIKVKHRFQCPMACSQDTDCRRYLYCETDLSCKTYLDGTDCVLPDNSRQCSCYRKNIGFYKGMRTCPLGYYGNNCQNIIKDCVEGLDMNITMGHMVKALVHIQPASVPFEAVCNFGFFGTTMMISRDRSCLHENFNRTMDEYKNGFGIVAKNRWFGLERMYEIFNLPSNGFSIMLVAVRSDYSVCQTTLHGVELGDETVGYNISYQSLDAECGNPFGPSLQNRFSTFDQDNTGSNKCAARFGGGWWFDATADCGRGFLTGSMDGTGIDNFLLDDTTGQSYDNFEISIDKY